MTRIIMTIAMAIISNGALSATPIENAYVVQIIGFHMSDCPQATPEKAKLLQADIIADIRSGKIDMTRQDIIKSEAMVQAKVQEWGKDLWCKVNTVMMQKW